MSARKKSAGKQRLRWDQLPADARSGIERLAGGSVVAAVSCTGGFSPGMASRLELSGGRRVFVKAMDAVDWPEQITHYRVEARVSAALPPDVPAPRLLEWSDDGRWVILVFECVDGIEPTLRDSPSAALRIAPALDDLATTWTPSPVPLAADHPRLGGWADLAMDPDALARLASADKWATDHLGTLIDLEDAGLAAAQGDTLVHFDAYPHNMLLAGGRVIFVDWPHARRGAPFVDLIAFASSAAGAGIDPDSLLLGRAATAGRDPGIVDAVLAAHAGFCAAGSLWPPDPDLTPIIAAKAELAAAAIAWLRRRLAR